MDDQQTIINWMLGILTMLVGFFSKSIREDVKDLERSDTAIHKELGEVRILVAGQYMPRADFDKVADTIFQKLDRIENKLDKKADKQ